MTFSEWLDGVRPVVLVGGRSRRFGRNKLLEPVGDGDALVDRPIRALREVFGSRVDVVGTCDDRVRERADGMIVDPYPGRGPAGGILASLERSQGDVFVLSGDLPDIDGDTVRVVAHQAFLSPRAWACWAQAHGPEPCIGVYRQGARPMLGLAVQDGRPLVVAIPRHRRVEAPIDPLVARNVNFTADLLRIRHRVRIPGQIAVVGHHP
jgi:molybdopterin-guanine dinucleotide biosynthesis protein A